MHSSFESAPATDDLNRRTLVKSAAWAMPVVAIAVSAPIAAASTGRARIALDTFAQNGVDLVWDRAQSANVVTGFKGSAQFRSEWDSEATVSRATLTITLEAKGIDTSVSPTVSGAGWSFGTVSLRDGNATFVFFFNGSVAANGQSTMLEYRLAGDLSRKDSVTPKSFSGVLTGSNFDSVSTTSAWH